MEQPARDHQGGGEKRVTGDDFKRIDVMEDKKIKSTRAANWSPLFLEPLRCEESRTKAYVAKANKSSLTLASPLRPLRVQLCDGMGDSVTGPLQFGNQWRLSR